jgi:hypothetical protein
MRLALLNHKSRHQQVASSMDSLQIGGSGKWLLNCAKNANKPTPVASAITTKKVNAPKRLASMRLLNHVTRHQETRKIEVRYDPAQLSAPYDKRREADD